MLLSVCHVGHTLHSDRYLASKCVGYTQKYMWGPMCSIIILLPNFSHNVWVLRKILVKCHYQIS